jgi:hypothetical protein
MSAAYRVTASDTTPEEPTPGWYTVDPDGEILGPFWDRESALSAIGIEPPEYEYEDRFD